MSLPTHIPIKPAPLGYCAQSIDTNITHLETIENVDVMISGRDEYDLIKFDRRRLYTLPGSWDHLRLVIFGFCWLSWN